MENVSYGVSRKTLKNIERVLSAILNVAIIIAGISHIVYCIIDRNPKELREMSAVKYAIDFSDGINPYSMSMIRDLPANSGCYGFMFPLIVSPILKLFTHENAIVVMEVLTVAASLLSAFFAYMLIKSKTDSNILASFSAIVLYLLQLMSGGFYSVAFPGQWGVMLLVLCTYLLDIDEHRNKYRPLLYALIMIVAFYTKQYFVLVSIPILVYLLLKSRIDGVMFAVYGIVLGIISIIVVQLAFPLYFSLAIGRAQVDSKMAGLDYPFSQLMQLVLYKRLWIVYLGVIFGIIFGIRGIVIQKKLNVSFELLAMVILFGPTFYMSRNSGQIAEYFTQLWMPYVLIGGVVGLKYIKERLDNCVIVFRIAFGIGILFFSINALKWEFINPFSQQSKTTAVNWKEAYELLDTYSDDGNIIVPPQLSQYCLLNDIYTCDYGQAQYMSTSAIEEYYSNKVYSVIFPYFYDLCKSNINYNKHVQDKIYEGYYDVVALNVEGAGNFTVESFDIGDKYYELKQIELFTGNQCWVTHFYIRK